MFHKFADFSMVIINQMLRIYPYMKTYLKIIPNSYLIFIAIVPWAMLRIQIVSFSDSERFG